MTQDDLFGEEPCPHCGHVVKTYRRTIHNEMARFMVLLAHKGVGEIVDIRRAMPSASKATSDSSYLVHWDFVTRPKRGLYSLTHKGLSFLQGDSSAIRYIYLREGVVVGTEGKIKISDVKGFDVNTVFAGN